MLSRHDTILKAFVQVLNNILIRYVGSEKNSPRPAIPHTMQCRRRMEFSMGGPKSLLASVIRYIVNIFVFWLECRLPGALGCSDDVCSDECHRLPVVYINQRKVEVFDRTCPCALHLYIIQPGNHGFADRCPAPSVSEPCVRRKRRDGFGTLLV